MMAFGNDLLCFGRGVVVPEQIDVRRRSGVVHGDGQPTPLEQSLETTAATVVGGGGHNISEGQL